MPWKGSLVWAGGHRHGAPRRVHTGMRPDHSLFLVDGMRISNSSSAVAHSDFELGWVPAVAIERIEVVRGPMSSLYGSEALGGVVNVITRAPTDTWRGELSSFGAWPEHSRGGDLRTAGAYVSGPLLPGVLGMSLWGQFQHQDAMVSAQNPRRTSMGEQEAFNGNMALTWTPDDAQQRIDLSYGAGKENRWRDTMGAGRYPRYYRSRKPSGTRLALSHEGNGLGAAACACIAPRSRATEHVPKARRRGSHRLWILWACAGGVSPWPATVSRWAAKYAANISKTQRSIIAARPAKRTLPLSFKTKSYWATNGNLCWAAGLTGIRRLAGKPARAPTCFTTPQTP